MCVISINELKTLPVPSTLPVSVPKRRTSSHVCENKLLSAVFLYLVTFDTSLFTLSELEKKRNSRLHEAESQETSLTYDYMYITTCTIDNYD